MHKDGILLTNHHVVSGQRLVSVETQNKEKIKAQVVQVNPLLDLAFLKIAKPLQAPQLTLADADLVANMDKVLVCGYPYGMPYTVTEGIVSSSRQLLSGQYYIQTDAAVNPGNSGGPMLNQKGEVITGTRQDISLCVKQPGTAIFSGD